MMVRLRPFLTFARSLQSINVHQEAVRTSVLPSSRSFAATPRHMYSSWEEAETASPDMTGAPTTTESQSSEDSSETFASLLRNSTFVQMGNPQGKVAVGRVYHIVDDDLYIDFGFKFPCVCKRPTRSRFEYRRGSKVRVLIKDLEMSEYFLGFQKPVTIMEAECVLLGPLSS